MDSVDGGVRRRKGRNAKNINNSKAKSNKLDAADDQRQYDNASIWDHSGIRFLWFVVGICAAVYCGWWSYG